MNPSEETRKELDEPPAAPGVPPPTEADLAKWIITKLKTLGEYYKPPDDGRDAVHEIYGWMHVLCFHYVQNRREVKEYDAARKHTKALEADAARLRADLAAAHEALGELIERITAHRKATVGRSVCYDALIDEKAVERARAALARPAAGGGGA